MYDITNKSWIDEEKFYRGSFIPKKRLHHAGDILGPLLFIYGGFDTETR
jgi:hypothetical protein